MRKPARLERDGAMTPRDRVWAAIRDFGKGNTFSVAEIMLLSEQRADTVLPYIGGLTKAGYLEQGAKRPTNRPRREFRWFSLVRDIGVEAPRVDVNGKAVTQGIGREQMWTGMRATKGDFDWRELKQSCPHPVSLYEIKTYLTFLQRAGYLAITQQSRGTVPARYRLVKARNTGPRPPLVTREKQVMDGNSGEIVYDPKANKWGVK